MAPVAAGSPAQLECSTGLAAADSPADGTLWALGLQR